MKRAAIGVNRICTTAAGGAIDPLTNAGKENHMTSKKQPVVRKPTEKIADSRKVRFGGGCAPARVVRSADAATADSGAVRFGMGCAPAHLTK